ncbi:VENN motif pre-toxin domain-containing protein [Cronobacter dublinensis]
MASLPINRSISGASDAAFGEAMGYLIAKEVYKKAPSQLNETEKQTVAALSTLASGLAGALAGNSTEAVAAAAKAGQTTVANNFLSQGRPKDFTEQLKGCNGNPSCEQGVRKDMAKESAENVLKLKSCWDAGDSACVAQMRTQIELNEKAYRRCVFRTISQAVPMRTRQSGTLTSSTTVMVSVACCRQVCKRLSRTG